MVPIHEFVLWLMPPPAVRRQFAELIGRLGRRHGGPVFEPHITLLGRFRNTPAGAEETAAELARELGPLDIRLTHTDYLDEYFRCLFVRAELTPALLRANQRAAKIFGQEPKAQYMPHLSLLYGDISAYEKIRITEEIGKKFDITFRTGELALLRIDSDAPVDWHVVKTYRLGTGADA